MLVPDVHDFPGHITCDPHSRSELVVQLIEDGALRMVAGDPPPTAEALVALIASWAEGEE